MRLPRWRRTPRPGRCARSGRLAQSALSSPRTFRPSEAGVPGYEATIWLGIMAPAGTPKEIVEKLNSEINKVIARPDVKEAWAKQGAVPMPMTPAEFDTYLRAGIEKWAEVVKVSGAKVN